MDKKEFLEREQINVLEFWDGMSLERFYVVLKTIIEYNSAVVTETKTSANGNAIAPLAGRTLMDAVNAANQIRDKNPHLAPVSTTGYALLNWAQQGLRNPVYTMPLTVKQWRTIFGMTKREFLDLRKNESSIYHFRPISDTSQRLVLPFDELPAGHLRKYHETVAESIEDNKS